MQPNSVDAGRAVGWYSAGWRIFMASPGSWIVMMLLIAVIMVLLQIIPLVGPLVLSLISPALGGGLMYAAREATEGRPIEVVHLFYGLIDEQKRTPILILGAALLGLSILLSIIAMVVIGGSIGAGVFSGAAGEANSTAVTVGAMSAGVILMFFITLVYGLVIFAVLAYAIPQVLFNGMPPTEAIKSSLNASLANVVPLSVFLVIYFILAVIAALPFFLGFLVLGPVTAAALYTSFRDIYPAETTASSLATP